MCAGEFWAVLPTTAAGWPPILTEATVPPLIWPANGCGSGVGTWAGPAGTITMCVSVAMIWSVALAAGCPICSLLIQVDRGARDLDRRVAVDLDLRAVQLERPGRLDRRVAALGQRDLGVADLDLGSGIRAARLRQLDARVGRLDRHAAVVDRQRDLDRPVERQRDR